MNRIKPLVDIAPFDIESEEGQQIVEDITEQVNVNVDDRIEYKLEQKLFWDELLGSLVADS